MKRLINLFTTLCLLFSPMLFAQSTTPNILLITADDMDYHSVGVNGSNVEDITPNIDRLANEGMRFTNAHVTVAVCMPSRGVIGTGCYPNNSGMTGFFPSKPSVPTLAEELKLHKNYKPGVLGKVKHSTPKKVEKYVWEYNQDAKDLGSGRSPKLYKEHFKQFIAQAKEEKRPFFMMANSHDPHRPFFVDNPNYEKGGKQRPSRIYTPEEIEVPGFLEDLPEVRRELANYFSSVKRCDDTIGALLDALEEEGLTDNTIVIFLSDNGMAFPFAKSNVYLQSTRTPFMVKWPKHIKAGQVNEKDMVSMVDLMPTLLEACGVDVPRTLDGRSFLPILEGKKQKDRDMIYTHYNETSGSKAFPMRAVQTHDYLYIFSPWAVGGRQYKTSSINGKSFTAMKEKAVEDEALKLRVDFCLFRTVTEFYDLKNDPNGLNNLADDPKSAKKIAEFEKHMLAYMEKTNDPMLDMYKHKDDEDYLIKATEKHQEIVNDANRIRRAEKRKERNATNGKSDKHYQKNKKNRNSH
ncbi:sulfatase [Flammeovirga sp. MY04]|uniref:sulfatase family protein n=1 Tax=Flammeovirga sp. MY04 TaxID=1191459 RepID=UPI000A892AA2|nr:sulfatase [Flammeovirga sp. MY04]ANQ52722.2 sulfatase [Flammeovirga sp. MY04]